MPTVGPDPRTLVIVALLILLAAATVAIITMTLLSDEPDAPVSRPAGGGLGSALVLPTMAPSAAISSAPSPSANPSPTPAGEVAGSEIIALDFDMLPTEAEIPDWRLTGVGGLRVAAVPTAVDRSARLDATDGATACRRLDVALGTLHADFMLDTVPGGGRAQLSVDLEDGTTLALMVTDAGAMIGDSSDPVSLEPGTWYRWVVTHEAAEVGLQLLSADGAPVADARLPVDDPRATEFCMGVGAGIRIYLDQLSMEAR